MRQGIQRLLILTLVSLLFCSIANAGLTQTLVILHMNDTHGRISSTSNTNGHLTGIGFDRIAGYKQELTASHIPVLLLDAGDTLHGLPMVNLSRGSAVVRLMNIMGVDAMAPGNHDFNYGFFRLKELETQMKFPLLGANVLWHDTEKPALNSWIIREMDGLRVGIFGLTTPECYFRTNPNNVNMLDFIDPAKAARQAVTELQNQKADVIIAITHLGLGQGDFTSDKLALEVPEINLIVDGHSHTCLPHGQFIKTGTNLGTLIVSRGQYNEAFGKVNLLFEDKNLVQMSAELIDPPAAESILPSFRVTAEENRIKAESEKILSRIIGHTKIDLEGHLSQVRTSETNLGHLLTAAMLEVSGADVAFANGGSIRDSIPAGNITIGDVWKVFPFGNYLLTKEVPGKNIADALSFSLARYPEEAGRFPHVGNITYDFKPATRQVSNIKIKGQPLDPQKTYLVVTNDFLASGGDGLGSFKNCPTKSELPALDEVLIHYIEKHSPLTGQFIPSQHQLL